jgi:predicted ATPase
MWKFFEIEQFRCCADTRITFAAPLTALIGKNGAGKTTILCAIESLANFSVSLNPRNVPPFVLSPLPSGFVAKVDIDNQAYEYSVGYLSHSPNRIDPDGITINERLVKEESSKTVLIDRKEEDVRIKGRTEPMRIGRSASAMAALSSLLPSDDPLQTHLRRLRSFFAGVKYYAFETAPDVVDDFAPESSFENWALNYQRNPEPIDSLALRLIYLSRVQSNVFAELLSLVGANGLDIIQQINIAKSGANEPGTGTTGTILIPLFNLPETIGGGGVGRHYRLSQLSAGTRRVLRILVSLLFDQRSVMLIEQPEDSIHPGLLFKLIDLLRSYSDRTQVVFSTHSTTVLNMLEPEEVLLVTAPQGNTQVRGLSAAELDQAKRFRKDEGSFSDFLETLNE